MPAKNFTAYVRHKGSRAKPWEETYSEETNDPDAWARATVQSFNDTLRDHEKPRELVRVVVHGEVATPQHLWRKQNWMTKARGDRTFDMMKCERCGITAKRWGLTRFVRDSAFRAKVYARCDTAMAHLAKKKVAG